jgi:hypothetical protein
MFKYSEFRPLLPVSKTFSLCLFMITWACCFKIYYVDPNKSNTRLLISRYNRSLISISACFIHGRATPKVYAQFSNQAPNSETQVLKTQARLRWITALRNQYTPSAYRNYVTLTTATLLFHLSQTTVGPFNARGTTSNRASSLRWYASASKPTLFLTTLSNSR